MKKSLKVDLPLYRRVRENILGKLATQDWAPGERIPTEPELAQLFSVSVGTVRRAIEDLVSENVLIRRARIGTTVATHQEHNQFSTFFNFLSSTGEPLHVSSRLISFGKTKATAELATIFNLKEKEPLFAIDNLRLIDNQAVMYDRIWLPEKIFQNLTKRKFENRNGSVYLLFQTEFKVTVLRIQEKIDAINPPDFIQKELNVKKTDAILRISRQAVSYGDEVVEFRNRYVNTKACQYLNALGLKE